VRGELFYCCEDCADGMECNCALILAEEESEHEAPVSSR
jgi:hypothetical protein